MIFDDNEKYYEPNESRT